MKKLFTVKNNKNVFWAESFVSSQGYARVEIGDHTSTRAGTVFMNSIEEFCSTMGYELSEIVDA